MRVKKGDTVQVIVGKDAGKKGKILRVMPGQGRIIVEGINRVTKHQKPSRTIPQGGILKIEAPLNASNVMLVCDRCKKPTRVGYKIMENNDKVRVCKKCGEALD